MKKFIAAFDSLNFSASTLQYATFLAAKCKAHLVGVFLEDFTRHSYGLAEVTHYEGQTLDKHMHELDEKDEAVRQESIEKFELACQERELNYSVHRDRNVAMQDLLHESIYADLIVINSGETLTRYEGTAPTRFIRELLVDVQCPVVLVPDQYEPIQKFTLLYDGEPSAVYAVRTFSYLFGDMDNIETEVITVKSGDQSLHLPDNKLMREFMKRHFPKAEYVILKGVVEDEIVNHLHREKRNTIVVLGAYRRTRLSRLFKASMADVLMLNVKFPLFIAHNRT
jgi:nucleotide-binding universal stress UspA family protein